MWTVRKAGLRAAGRSLTAGEAGTRGTSAGIDDGGDNNILPLGWGLSCVLFMSTRSGAGLFGGNRKKKRIKKRQYHNQEFQNGVLMSVRLCKATK